MIDPKFMELFYNYNISINTEGLTPTYFGYRKAWYSLFYDKKEDVMKTIDYIQKAGDCSYTALIHYIIWLSLEENNNKNFDIYNNILYDDILNVPKLSIEQVYNYILNLEKNKIYHINNIKKHLIK